MKRITFALIAAVLVVAAVAVVSGRLPVGVEGLFGFGAAVALVGVAAADYRLTAPRMFGK